MYICSDHAPKNNEIATLLYANLDDEQSFSHTQLAKDGTLQSVAVARIKDTTQRESIEKVAQEIASWATQQNTINISLEPFCQIKAPLIAEILTLALGEATYRFDRYKQTAKPSNTPQICMNGRLVINE